MQWKLGLCRDFLRVDLNSVHYGPPPAPERQDLVGNAGLGFRGLGLRVWGLGFGV